MLIRRLKQGVGRYFSQAKGGLMHPPHSPVDSPFYDQFEVLNKKFKGQDQILSSRIYPELLYMQRVDQKLKNKVKSFEQVCRRNLFVNNLFLKSITKEYIQVTKKTGYNEFVMEVFFRYFANYTEIKGERSMKGLDIDGRMFWDTSFFQEIRKDLLYMGLPGVEVDSGCLISILKSFQRLKFKDYEVLQGLTIKLIMESRSPGISAIDQGTQNPFSAVELLKYYYQTYRKNDHVSGK
jgi:hypothetical protein